MKYLSRVVLFFVACAFATSAGAQGVTTGSMSGRVVDAQSQPVVAADVIAIHIPSGTAYDGKTREDGRFSIIGMRVGGPYSVTVTYGGTGNAFEPFTQDDITVNLGAATDLDLKVQSIAVTETVTVTAASDAVFSSERTGASTTVTRESIAMIPTLSNRLDSVVRMTPQASGSSIAGQDNRMNNITIDGSYFNNSFGLGGQPGDRTGVAPISLEAIEQVQVNVAPFDVRQGNFIGGGINSVTRSGANNFAAAGFWQFRNEGMVGTEAKDAAVNPGTFSFRNGGGWVSGPIIRNKLFFFVNYEDEELKAPGTTFTANPGGAAVGGNMTRVLASDLTGLSSFLNSNFKYDTGPFEGFDHQTPGTRYLAKVDFNLNNRNKISFRYNQLDSITDVLSSNSSSLGFGNRRTSTQALNFQNNNYQIMENNKSGVGEWNLIIGNTMANSLIVGYGKSDESRKSRGTFFPMVDILQSDLTYTSFGFEAFTPNNELRYNTFQLQENFTKFGRTHSLTFGGSYEKYRSENVFYPGSQSVYVYNSLADFYTDANGYLQNPNRTTSPVTLRIFQVRYMNIPGLDKPLQPLEVQYTGAYVQDEWSPRSNVKVTAGVRGDVALFGETGYQNVNADALTFRDETGAGVQYNTAKLPDANILWSPRLGFNWDVFSNRNTQVRGGTGIFTGKPAFVWISNQIGNTGVLTGFEDLRNTTARPFNPDPNKYKPTNVTGAPAASYELALTNEDFKFPQLWRTNIAIDQRLPWGITGTAELLYGRDVNGMYYINANLPAAQSAFVGADNRARYTANRIYSNVANAVVLKNQSEGRSLSFAASARKNFSGGMLQTAYSYGKSENTVDPGSIAFGSWSGNAQSGDPNNPGLSYAQTSPGHRFYLSGSYRKEYFNFGATGLSFFFEARTIGNASYIFASDMNGDGATNDLLYIHKDQSEMNFSQFATGGVTYTAAQQAAAWDAYIAQDPYLSKHRGEYAVRGAVFLPLVKRMDLSLSQDLFASLGGRKHRMQVRADVTNVGNLLNKNWGVSQRLVSNSPLTNPSVDSQGRSTYRMRVVNGQLMNSSYQQTAFVDSDVYRVMVSFRYFFN